MGLDVGDKTIGVAVSDGLLLTAQGRTTIMRKNAKDDIDKVVDMIVDENVTTVVCGLPKNMNGTVGPQGEKTQAFAKSLEKKIKYSDRTKGLEVNIVFWDERLTTVAAERALIEGDVSRKKRKDLIDMVAASVILQGYLDWYNKNREEV